jgi:hypothetical protein
MSQKISKLIKPLDLIRNLITDHRPQGEDRTQMRSTRATNAISLPIFTNGRLLTIDR